MKKLFAVLAVVICAGAGSTYLLLTRGCRYFPESTFTLASESRLPKWIVLPAKQKRSDTELVMSYYVLPSGRTAGFELRDNKREVLSNVDAKVMCSHPVTLPNAQDNSATNYPSYEAITVNGATEIVEHKRMEPIFYVTDDAAVWQHFKAGWCD